jgi:SAM-dependent methyltransferase
LTTSDPILQYSGARRSTSVARFYPESSFGGFTDVDGTVAFYARVNALLGTNSVVVDFGCGRGRASEDPVRFRRELQCLKGKTARVIGIDIDAAGAQNPTLDEFRRLPPDGRWPLEDRSVNLIVCDHVMEHLPDPARFFLEAKRVLAKDGFLCIRTPNLFGYVGLVSKLVPERLHSKLLSRAQPDRHEKDVFPTLYRCNSVSALRRNLSHCGFRVLAYGHEAEPSYLNFSTLAYAMGVVYQRFAPAGLRNVIHAFGQKQY